MMKPAANPKPIVRLDRAIQHFGGRKQLAEYFGINVEAVMNWQRENRETLPDKRALEIALFIPDLTEERTR